MDIHSANLLRTMIQELNQEIMDVLMELTLSWRCMNGSETMDWFDKKKKINLNYVIQTTN